MHHPQIHGVTELFSPIVSEHFEYETIEVLRTLIENSESAQKELVILNEQQHFHQCDFILISPIETYLVSWHKWQTNFPDLYKMNTMILLRFMAKLGVGHFDPNSVEEWLSSREKKYLNYLHTYTPEGKANEEIAAAGDDSKQSLLTK